MRIDLVFPTLPPALDGIGDHTALLAQELARAGCTVRVRTAQEKVTPIPGVTVSTDFSLRPPHNISDLVEAVAADPPDWLFVQFNQFSYGRYGFNPWLPLTLRRIRRAVPNVKIAWMAHEDFVPAVNWKFAVMTLWQRWQFWALGRQADQIFFSIAPWVDRYRRWFPNTPVAHLPVGSNIPRVDCPPAEARRRLDIPPQAFVTGVFGTLAGGTRQIALIAKTVRALRVADPDVYVLYVGPHGDHLREHLPDTPFHDAGRLPADQVSMCLTAMDLHLAPFADGLSTRRGSAMAGLQHGVATLSTEGGLTDSMLRDANGRAMVLPPVERPDAYVEAALHLRRDAPARRSIAQAGSAFYGEHFSGRSVARRLLDTLRESSLSAVV